MKKFAPVLGTAIGGPAGGAVGGAVSLLMGAFGLGGDSTPDQVAAAIAADPHAALKLKELEMTHQEELAKLALASDQAFLADRQGARQREVDVVKATGHSDHNLYILAWTVVVGFFALCGLLMQFPLPKDSNSVVFMLFGSLGTGFGTVLQYFFGSSKSSADKTQIIAAQPAKGVPHA